MSKEYILQYIRDLKSVIDYHVENGIPIGDAVDPDLQGVCDKLVQSGIMLEPQFMNELYKFIIYLESVKDTTDIVTALYRQSIPNILRQKSSFRIFTLNFLSR